MANVAALAGLARALEEGDAAEVRAWLEDLRERRLDAINVGLLEEAARLLEAGEAAAAAAAIREGLRAQGIVGIR